MRVAGIGALVASLALACGDDAVSTSASGGSGDGGTALESESTASGGDLSPADRPPGRVRMVYRAGPEGEGRLWWVSYEDGVVDGPRSLTPPIGGVPVRASPRGGVMLVNGGVEGGGLGILPADPDLAGNFVIVNHDPIVPQPATAESLTAEFTPDDRGLLFRASGADWNGLYYTPITEDGAGSTVPIVGPHPWTYSFAFVLTRDGDRVVFHSDVNGDGAPETYIAGVPPDGSGDITPLVASAAELGQLAPDGNTYVFRAGPVGAEELFVMPLQGLEPGTPIAVPGPPEAIPVENFELAPDGTGVAYMAGVEEARRVYYAPIQEGAPGSAGPVGDLATPAPWTSLMWSPRAQWLGFRAGAGQWAPPWYLSRIVDNVPGPTTLIGEEDTIEFGPDDTVAWQLRFDIVTRPGAIPDTENHRLWRIDLSGEVPGTPEIISTASGEPLEPVDYGSVSGQYRLVRTPCRCVVYRIDDLEAPLTAVPVATESDESRTVSVGFTNDDRLLKLGRDDREPCSDGACSSDQVVSVVAASDPSIEANLLTEADFSASSSILLPEL